MSDNLAEQWLTSEDDSQLDELTRLAELPAERDVLATIGPARSASAVADRAPAAPPLRLTSTPRTTVLHTRVVAGTGGGPEKTILRSPRYADKTYIRMAAAYIHPAGDAGINVLRARAKEQRCPLYTIAERGPFDPRTLRRLYMLCKELRVTVWHAHDYKSNLFGLLLRRFWKMKLVTTVHGWTNDTWRTKLYYHADKYCLPRYDQVLAVSPVLEQQCLDLGVPRDRLTYVANGIDAREFTRRRSRKEARYELGVWPHAFVIGVVSRLSKEKGVDRAVRVAAELHRKHANVELHLIGDGPEYDNLKALARELGVAQAVHFWGWQSDARRFYETMDMMLLPSHTEGFPNAVLEAMAMGVPVAATDVGAVRQLLKQGRRGVVLDRDDITDWAAHIEPLIVSEPRRRELAYKGRRRVEKYFSFETRMQNVLDLYDRLLSIEPKQEDTAWRRAA